MVRAQSPSSSRERAFVGWTLLCLAWVWGMQRLGQRPLTALSCPRSLQGLQWRNVEEEFPHMYTHGCVMKDVCSDCTGFVADVVVSNFLVRPASSLGALERSGIPSRHSRGSIVSRGLTPFYDLLKVGGGPLFPFMDSSVP